MPLRLSDSAKNFLLGAASVTLFPAPADSQALSAQAQRRASADGVSPRAALDAICLERSLGQIGLTLLLFGFLAATLFFALADQELLAILFAVLFGGSWSLAQILPRIFPSLRP